METTSIINQGEKTLAFFEDETNLKLTPRIDRGYPIVNGHAKPLLSLRMHEDGSCSVRIGNRWIHDLWPDKRLQLLASVRRYNGNGNGGSFREERFLTKEELCAWLNNQT